MIIKTLVENTSISKEYGSEHGLSLYIETKRNKLLFDVGASGLFFQNAIGLNVDISDVDFLVISHGHYDHGGGLKTFFEKNYTSKVYLHKQAINSFYAMHSSDELVYIGLDEGLKHNSQIIYTSDNYIIDKGIWLLSDIRQEEPQPKSNKGLFIQHNGQIIDDSFSHEQNLVLEEDGKTLLLTGCAHNGIINILKNFYAFTGRMPDYVIGGFHLSRSGEYEDLETIDGIGKYLIDTKAKYYTGHCTGLKPYKRLKSLMGDRIDYLSTGSEIKIY